MGDPLLLVVGLVAVIIGAELVVRHGAGLAARFGIPPMLVGMTVVALATSVPELAVGLSAARQGSPDLAVGNIVGTNLVNILLVLGLSAAIRAITFEDRTLRVDLPMMIGAAVVLLVLARDGALSTPDGLILTAVGVAYLAVTVQYGRQLSAAKVAVAAAGGGEVAGEPAVPSQREGSPAEQQPPLVRGVLLLVLGLVVVVVGSELLVEGSVGIARSLGVSEAVIGLTVIAIGTSTPELVTTVVSTVRNERSLAIGNLIGSSVFNIALVLGPTVLASSGDVPVSEAIIGGDLMVMVAVAVLCLPTFWSHRRLGRIEGGVFVAGYVAYLVWMVVGLE